MAWDRLKNSIERLVNEVVGHRLDYLARYPGKVIAQLGSLVSVVPDDARLPTLVGVSVRTGVAGAQAIVAPGARVLIGFEAGDPRYPFVDIWESTIPLTLVLTAATSITLAAPSVAFAGPVSMGSMAPPATATKLDIDAGIKPLELKGSLVKLSAAAALPVARVGDSVAVVVGGVPGVGTITGPGNLTVLA
jgi:hypothetical protein